ncbi:hypothetical protein BRAS3843_940021 [Bradyrhizobium sp. STM 3843]|nr:hypothetical protein BRAS3843_940021 [Bradyrhizobium sp. STM 3843]
MLGFVLGVHGLVKSVLILQVQISRNQPTFTPKGAMIWERGASWSEMAVTGVNTLPLWSMANRTSTEA